MPEDNDNAGAAVAPFSESPCSALVETITMYRTTDGDTFNTKRAAIGRQESIEEAKQANLRLESGHSVGDILRDLGRNVPDEVLYRVTKDSALVVPHWQCRDTPGYKPISFEPGMRIYVYGNAGSWSGPYGGEMQIADLVRYAKDCRSVLAPNAESEVSE